MLIDHVAQHAARLFLVAVAAEAAATPRNLFPNEQAQLVAQIENRARLLKMAKTDEVCAEVFDQLHLFAHEILGHGRAEAGVIFMTLRAANQQSLAVEFEWSVLDELKRAHAKLFADFRYAVAVICDRYETYVERWFFRRPQHR